MGSLSAWGQRPPKAAIRLTIPNDVTGRRCSKCGLAERKPLAAKGKSLLLQEGQLRAEGPEMQENQAELGCLAREPSGGGVRGGLPSLTCPAGSIGCPGEKQVLGNLVYLSESNRNITKPG